MLRASSRRGHRTIPSLSQTSCAASLRSDDGAAPRQRDRRRVQGERFLAETLESLFAQDFESFEAVFVDDGSEDRTGEIARSFPLRYVRQENQGLPAARNAGLDVARGRLIAFLDDDDILPPPS